MLTIFTIPKPFQGHNNIIQRNAIKSWMMLKPECEIILFGDDEGVGDAAQEFGVRHVPSVEMNEYGTPLLSSAFQEVQQVAKNNTIMYTNADIIFTPDLTSIVEMVDFPQYLVCGRRWDVDIQDFIDFDAEWVAQLRMLIQTRGRLHGFSGIDYFIFRKGTVTMREFSVGRPGWDSWLLYDMRSRKIPIINATDAVTVIHQNHDYAHSQFGTKEHVAGPEWQRNIEMAGGLTRMMTLRDADWELTNDGLTRPSVPKRIYSLFSLWYPWRLMLATKRKLENLRG